MFATSCSRKITQFQKSVHGAVVEDVVPGSPADNAGLQQGDVIMEVDRHAMKSASDVAQALSQCPEWTGCAGAGVVEWGQHLPCVASFARVTDSRCSL